MNQMLAQEFLEIDIIIDKPVGTSGKKLKNAEIHSLFNLKLITILL